MRRIAIISCIALIGAYLGTWCGVVFFELAFPADPHVFPTHDPQWRVRDEWREAAIIAGLVSGSIVALAAYELGSRFVRKNTPHRR